MKKLSILALATVMSVTAFASKIGIVNSQELYFKYPKTKIMENNLRKQKEALENSIKQKEVELKKLQVELSSKNEKVTKEDNAKFEKKVAEFQKFIKDSESKFQKQSEICIGEIRATMDKAIEKVAKDGKYDYILEAGVVKFGGKDVTDKVLKEMEKNK